LKHRDARYYLGIIKKELSLYGDTPRSIANIAWAERQLLDMIDGVNADGTDNA